MQAAWDAFNGDGCPCWTCLAEAAGEGAMFLPMIVCEHCGNKRCPHATHHEHPCTGSNEPGQPGSRYPDLFAPSPLNPTETP